MTTPTTQKSSLFFYCSLLIALLAIPGTTQAQIFWTEDFNNGCTANCAASSYTGPNGTWVETTGPGNLGFAPNEWYVSCAENGHTNTICGSGCVAASATATLASLHVGSTTAGDIGAAYDAGGCGGGCTDTDIRAESPTINCTGRTNITLTFDYLEFGDGAIDDGSVEYFDGATWSLLANTAKTTCCGGPCNGFLQGRWTSFSITLPASANNNPGIKIGFHWINNDDGVGTDPSFAIDNMTLSVPSSGAPVAAFTASATTICVNDPVNFTDNTTNGPTSWSWTFPGGTPGSSTSQNVTGVTWAVAGTYTVTLTATNGSGSSSTTQVITVNPLPTVTASANPMTICVGQQTQLSGTGATTYVWNPGNISGNPITVSPAATTTYTVTGTSAAGCDATAQVTVTVNSCSGPISVFSSNDTNVCVGQPVDFTDLSTGGPTSWSWTFPGGTPASSTSQNVTGVTWSTPGSYTVTLTVTNASGSTSSTIVINVSAPPTVTAIANPTTICVGQQTTLTGSGAVSYVWNPGNISGSPVNVTPAATTTYTVTGTDANGCTGTATVTVTVQPCSVPQVLFLANDTVICVGDCINFTDQSTNNPTSWSWTFSGSSTPSSTAQNPSNICYPAAGTFAVTLIANNASGSGSLTKTGYIIVNPAPAANAGNNATICTGQQTTLTGTGGTTYLWNPGNLSGATVTVTPASTTTYTLTVTDANGCTGTDQVTITVNTCTAPVAALSASDNSVCESSCIDFTDVSSGAPTGWSWSFPGGTPATSTLQNPTNICYNTPGTYNVVLIVTNAFGTDTITMTSYITVGAQPTVNAGPYVTIAIGNSTQLSATGGAGSYLWVPSTGLSSTTSQNPTASPTVTTTYTVTLTDAFGCTASDTVTVEVIEAYALFVPSAFSPNGDGANDVLFVRGAGIKTLTFVVYDRFGEKVFESASINDGWDGSFRGKDMNTGIYVFYVTATFYNNTEQSLKGDISLVR